jgi:hypothetical protein
MAPASGLTRLNSSTWADLPVTSSPFLVTALPPDAFSDATIGPVLVAQDATDLHLTWTATSPAGTVFQVYVNRRLVWHGTERSITIPVPNGLAAIQVGSVPAANEETDFSAVLPLPGGTGDRVRLSWLGGTYLDRTGGDDIAGFHVYGSPGPGQALNSTTALSTLAAYPGGTIADGFGQGGFGQGGFGRAASTYAWTSGRLASGAWSFGVLPFDVAGNEAAAGTPLAVSISTRPRPPAPNPTGQRLAFTYAPQTHLATLHWLASPG